MKFRYNSYLRKVGNTEEKYYCIEYNDTNEDFDVDWFEYDDFTEEMVKDITELLNKKYGRPPTHRYKK